VAPGVAPPAPGPAPPSPERAEAPTVVTALWDRVEPFVDTELEIAWEELGGAATRQTNEQVQNFFGRFDRSAKADQKFSDIINIAAGGGGNALQDKLSDYASLSGGIGGAIAQAVQVLLAHALNTDRVGEVRSRAQEAADKIEREEFTVTSPLFMAIEQTALASIEQEFGDIDSWWILVSASHGPSEASEADVRKAIDRWGILVRGEYGVNSEFAQGVLKDLHEAVQDILDPVEAPLRRELRERRMQTGALAGGITGALIGTALGAGLSGGSVGGWVAGGVIGWIGGELLGLAGGAIASWLSKPEPEAAEKRPQKKVPE
jgi:hypothetical protein